MPHARHGRSSGSRHSHRPASALRPVGRRRALTMLTVAAAGLVVAFWLPTRNDSASANENGFGSRGQNAAWWNYWGGGHNRPQNPVLPGMPQGPGRLPGGIPGSRPTPSDSPSETPSTEPTSDDPTGTPPTGTSPTAAPPTTTAPSSAPPTSTAPTSTAPTTAAPTTAAPTTATPTTAPAATKWAAYTDYTAGQIVTYKGKNYKVLEDHTSLPGWEPPALPALFELVS
jgi:hypothetical protein